MPPCCRRSREIGGHLRRVQGDDDGLEVEEQQGAHARIPQQTHARVDAARGTRTGMGIGKGMRSIEHESLDKMMLLDGERQMAAMGDAYACVPKQVGCKDQEGDSEGARMRPHRRSGRRTEALEAVAGQPSKYLREKERRSVNSGLISS